MKEKLRIRMRQWKEDIVLFYFLCGVLFIVLVFIIANINHVTDFKTAYIQLCIFLMVTNWFDGIVVDRLWVGHSKIWLVAGMEDVPYVKPWKNSFDKKNNRNATLFNYCFKGCMGCCDDW